MEEKDVVLTPEQVEEGCDCEQQSVMDDKLIELEIEKEIIRVEREEEGFKLLPNTDEDNVSKEIARDADAFANFYSRLVLSGVHSDIAGQLLMNYMTCRYNLEQGRLDIEKAKFANILQQGQVI